MTSLSAPADRPIQPDIAHPAITQHSAEVPIAHPPGIKTRPDANMRSTVALMNMKADMVLRRSKTYPVRPRVVRELLHEWPEGPEPEGPVSMNPVRWQPERPVTSNPWPHPPMATAIGRGLLGRCPACGKSLLFNGFLRVATECRNCGAPLGLARADDAPPYFTILITGHIIVPLMYLVDRAQEPPLWIMCAIFLPLTLIMALGLLLPVKGGTVGLMLNLNMLKSDPSET
jgi:uncharacterized protein (DUF983 family)